MLRFVQLQIVVGEAERAVAERDQQHRPDIAVAQIDPQQRGDERARAGSARRPWSACPSSRSDAAPARPARIGWPLRCTRCSQRISFGPTTEADHQRRQARGARAEGDVAEQVEQDELVGERLRAGRTASGALRQAIERSDDQLIRLPRLPLTSTASPGRTAAHHRRERRRSRRHARRACADGTASNRPRISGPQANTLSAAASNVGRQRGVLGRAVARPVPACRPARRCARAARLQRAAPQRRAHRRRRWRCSSRPAAGRCRPATRSAGARRARRPAAKPSSAGAPSPASTPSAAAAASAASAFIAMCRPGAARRNARARPPATSARHRCRRRRFRPQPAARRPRRRRRT